RRRALGPRTGHRDRGPVASRATAAALTGFPRRLRTDRIAVQDGFFGRGAARQWDRLERRTSCASPRGGGSGPREVRWARRFRSPWVTGYRAPRTHNSAPATAGASNCVRTPRDPRGVSVFSAPGFAAGPVQDGRSTSTFILVPARNASRPPATRSVSG